MVRPPLRPFSKIPVKLSFVFRNRGKQVVWTRGFIKIVDDGAMIQCSNRLKKREHFKIEQFFKTKLAMSGESPHITSLRFDANSEIECGYKFLQLNFGDYYDAYRFVITAINNAFEQHCEKLKNQAKKPINNDELREKMKDEKEEKGRTWREKEEANRRRRNASKKLTAEKKSDLLSFFCRDHNDSEVTSPPKEREGSEQFEPIDSQQCSSSSVSPPSLNALAVSQKPKSSRKRSSSSSLSSGSPKKCSRTSVFVGKAKKCQSDSDQEIVLDSGDENESNNTEAKRQSRTNFEDPIPFYEKSWSQKDIKKGIYETKIISSVMTDCRIESAALAYCSTRNTKITKSTVFCPKDDDDDCIILD